MAFVRKVGSVLKQSGSKHVGTELFSSYSVITSAKLFVGGLSYNTDEIQFREAFDQYGEVIDAKVYTYPDSSKSRGFGFVSYTTVDAANAAIQYMNGKKLDGRRLRVKLAQEYPRLPFGSRYRYTAGDDRGGGGGRGGGGRGRGRGRGR